MDVSDAPAGVLALCPRCGVVQLDDDRWRLDVRWTLLRDPDAAPLRGDRAVTAAEARWQSVGDKWECEGCGWRVPWRHRSPPAEAGCACVRGAA